MVWLDVALLLILAVSVLYSLVRGFVREALSLVGWVLALWVALKYYQPLAGRLGEYIGVAEARSGLAFLLLFLTVMIASMLVNRAVVRLVRLTGLGGADRLLGVAFGLLRGVVIVTVIVLFGGMTPLTEEPVWKHSFMVGYSRQLTAWAAERIPRDITSHLPEGLQRSGVN